MYKYKHICMELSRTKVKEYPPRVPPMPLFPNVTIRRKNLRWKVEKEKKKKIENPDTRRFTIIILSETKSPQVHPIP